MVEDKADILVIDDEPDNLKLIVQILSKQGYFVRPVTSGKRALKAMKYVRPDLILLDVLMPGLDGYEICEIIKQNDKLKDIPVIFLSALDKTFDKVKGLKVGGADYISKPFQTEELIERVKTHLEIRELNQAVVEKKQIELEGEVIKRSNVEKTLRENEELFRNFATVIDDVFFIISPDYRTVKFVSPAAEKLYGIPAEEILENSKGTILKMMDLVHPEDRQIVEESINKRLDGDYSKSPDYRILNSDGSIKWITSQAYPVLDKQGQINHFIGVYRDVTDRKELENELLQSRKMEAIGQMTGGIAHDFNNLLAVILGNLILLEMDMEDGNKITNETLKKLIGEAIEAGRMGADLTKKLLTFSRKTALDEKQFDLNQIVTKVEKLIKRTLPGNIVLKTVLEETNTYTKADSTFLESSIINLAMNASDAMPKGGSLTIETGKETIENDISKPFLKLKAGDYVTLSVIDTGLGMDIATLEKVFDPFFTTKKLGKGTGLGLSVVYGFVTQSGGGILIKSKPDHGSVVKIYLPEVKHRVTEKSDKKKMQIMHTKKKTILVVEDEEGVRKYAIRSLVRQGYNVLEAEDGETAIDIIKSNKNIDILLTDIVLSGAMNGYELAKATEDLRSDVKILCMSGYIKDSILDGIEREQNYPLIDKPFTPKQLSSKLLDLFAN